MQAVAINSSINPSIAELADLVRAPLPASCDSSQRITKLAPLDAALANELSFLSNRKWLGQLRATKAGAVFLKAEHAEDCPKSTIALVVADPYLAYAKASQLWGKAQQTFAAGIHPQAYVAKSAAVAGTASIGAFAYIGEGVVVGEHTVIHPRVTVLDNCVVGSRCILHSGCVVGSDGFGFAPEGSTWVKIAQLGKVVMGDDVEIGANTTIDRGALNDTRIGNGVKLDNQIQIAHNVVIGEHTAIAACVGIAGSTVIGKRCTIGGAAGIIGHLKIADDVHISAFSLVQSSIEKPGHYTGVFPLDEHGNWEKNAATLKHLSKLRERVRALESNHHQIKPNLLEE